MDQAYTELYQEFLRLRSLCMQQAALLNQLTEALRKRQAAGLGHHVNRSEDTDSLPVQCSQEEPRPSCRGDIGQEHLHQTTLPVNGLPNHSHPRAVHLLATGLDTIQLHDDRLAKGGAVAHNMSPAPRDFLQVGEQQMEMRRAGGMDVTVTGCSDTVAGQLPQYTFPPAFPLAPPLPPSQRPRMNSTFMNSELLSQAGGLLMSELTLHSQVCEFCHAVFPGNTSTMGDFLRHLNSHVT